MDLGEDSSIFGTFPSTLRIPSSSSSTFFSANQSPISLDSATHSDNLGHATNINMDSLDTDWRNLDSESLAGARFASGEVDPGAEACTSSDPKKLENVSSSTVIYNSALSGYGVPRSSIRPKGKGKKIGRLLEISAPLPSLSSNRLRNCDVFIGFHGRKPQLLRFANWLRAELEVQGLSCFVTDRARCRNSRKHSIVEKAMDASTFGVIVLTRKSFRNPYTIEELKFFSSKKNLVPIYFDVAPNDCLARDIIEKRGEVWERYGGELWLLYGGVEREWRDAVGALSCVDDWKLEAHDGRWRDCILRAVTLLALRLGRRSVVDRLTKWREKAEREEFPFPQNESFVGRKKELSELEFMLFGDVCGDAERDYFELKATPRRKNLKIDERPSSRRESSKGKGKEPVLWKESEKEIEMQNTEISQPEKLTPRPKSSKHGRPRRRSMKAVYGKGIACVSGDPGIGKTELLLEYAYRFHQRYKMVLWIGGESRYIRQNYLNLWSFLEVDVGVESCTGKGRTKSFEEQEEAAIARVRKELMRNIPFLLIIDNLESEKDWWDHKLVMDLLPRFGGETHVIISTRLSSVMNLEPLRLSFLSGVEAMTLMQGGLKDQSITEIDALRAIEEKLGRLTLGLAVVGAILSELPINPSRLLDTINRMPSRDITWSGRENHNLRRNIFLVQLFEVCFSIFDHADGPGSLATRMVLASGWFAPGPVPVQILALAAHRIPEKQHRRRLWKNIMYSLTCGFTSSYARRSESEASSLLLRFNMARSCTKEGFIKLDQLVKLYARKRGITGVAEAMVQAVISRGSVSHHSDHIWAACFLLLGFGKDPIVVELKVTQLLFLVKQAVLPLAIRTFITFSRCSAALELLRLCTDALEAADQAFVTPVEKWLDKSFCWKPVHTNAQLNPYLWQELALTRATVLEVRAKLMARGGQLDIADDLIRKAIFVRTSICGQDHPNTISAQETLTKFTRLNASLQNHTSP
ncbi:Disease resistance protein [Perilla frutescens var. frutescens]|nr:Disease resistance protein [Perilla frutescens var. frutescens]